jgi:hypothetical protein
MSVVTMGIKFLRVKPCFTEELVSGTGLRSFLNLTPFS